MENFGNNLEAKKSLDTIRLYRPFDKFCTSKDLPELPPVIKTVLPTKQVLLFDMPKVTFTNNFSSTNVNIINIK